MDAVLTQTNVRSLSVGGDGSVFAADAQGLILQNTESASAWTPLAQSATCVSVSHAAGYACAVSNGDAALMDLKSGGWTPLGTTGTKLTMVSVGQEGPGAAVVWAVDTARGLWRAALPFTSWQRAPAGITADAIAATADGDVYRLDGGALWSSTGTAWSPIATLERARSVGASILGSPWIVGHSGAVYRYDGSRGWNRLPSPVAGKVGQISAGEDATVWLVVAGALYAFDPRTASFVELAGPNGATLVQAAVSTQEQAFAVDASQRLYRYTENLSSWNPLTVNGLPAIEQVATVGGSWFYALDGNSDVWMASVVNGAWTAHQLAGQLRAIAPAQDGTVWGLDAAGAAQELVAGAWQTRSTQLQHAGVSVATQDVVAALDAAGAAWESERPGRSQGQPTSPSGSSGPDPPDRSSTVRQSQPPSGPPVQSAQSIGRHSVIGCVDTQNWVDDRRRILEPVWRRQPFMGESDERSVDTRSRPAAHR